jgi:hypothetical protein
VRETARHILDALEEEVTPDGAILLARLLDLSPDLLVVPPRTFDEARKVLGDSVMGRTGKIATPFRSKVAHALKVWHDKYGPLNAEQYDYADQLLRWTIRSGAEYAKSQGMKHPAPIIWANLMSIVNHERADAGFKQRSSKKDVAAEVAEALDNRRDG